MNSFLKDVVTGVNKENAHKYFLRFGRGDYKGRFLISFNIGKRVKIRSSFELANDIVRFVRENKDVKFSGKILSKEKIAELEGRKKAGVFVYEVNDFNLKKENNFYYSLLDVEDSDFILKIKKSLPKPGKDEAKVDDKFCSLDSDLKYWPALKNSFFWDVPDGNKGTIEHELIIDDIVLPKNEKDPAKIRENALRKGKLIRKINVDGKEIVREYALEV